MKNKQIFDYQEPFNAPYLIRELAKNVKFPFVVYAQDFTIATITLLMVTVSFSQLMVMISIAIPYGMVQLFNQVEPDGKRIDLFLKDYISSLRIYVLPKKVLYHEQRESLKQKKYL
ncbi:MAG: TcpE family conjugal transfer membrane protein [Liquorilactobacillus ghanensis]|uniref:TcpE family conjugal transfer membrane protein n=1 Tax=Liquorilactobacillus ghanensis TaxID=399370 RepID=UPI0039E75C44